jgi:hypothetical protein
MVSPICPLVTTCYVCTRTRCIKPTTRRSVILQIKCKFANRPFRRIICAYEIGMRPVALAHQSIECEHLRIIQQCVTVRKFMVKAMYRSIDNFVLAGIQKC